MPASRASGGRDDLRAALPALPRRRRGGRVRRRPHLPPAERRRRWIATGVAAVVLLVLTAVFDSVMIAAGLFGYADGTRLGPAIGLAPIEDFAYPVAAVLLAARGVDARASAGGEGPA